MADISSNSSVICPKINKSVNYYVYYMLSLNPANAIHQIHSLLFESCYIEIQTHESTDITTSKFVNRGKININNTKYFLKYLFFSSYRG